MNALTYSLTPVSEQFTGGAKVYRAIVQTKGTIDQDRLVDDLAEKTRLDKSLVAYFLLALNEQLEARIKAGYRVNIGQLATGFVIRGAFASADDRFDPARHELVPTVRALEPLKSALDEIAPENVTMGLVCTVCALMDAVTKEANCITGSNEIHVQGVNLGIDADNPDEGVVLVDDEGAVKATATVAASDAQTITCSFPTPPEPGTYALVVNCRNGNRTSLAPAVGKLKNVVVKAA